MKMKRLEFGDSLSGLLIDGVEGTPYVGATIRMTRDKGVMVEVPYLPNRDIVQFDHLRGWFNEESPPVNMLLSTPEGMVSLFDVAWSGHSENWGGVRASIGTVRPALAVLGARSGEIGSQLLMEELRSRLDGLNEWSRLSSVECTPHTDEEYKVRSVELLLEKDDGIRWQQGDAVMAIRAGWYYAPDEDGYGRAITVHNNAYVESRFDSGPKPFLDHFVEQRKVANLMVFLFGRPLAFREHNLRDELFATSASKRPAVEVVSRHTYQERRAEIPTKKGLGRPIAFMSQVGAEGLATWSENYETWERFILPSAGVLGQTARFIEDLVVSTSMSLEAAGGIIGERTGERETWSDRGRSRPTTATFVYRCLDLLDVHWPDRISNRVGLSKAIANNYNEVKHFDRGDFPDHDESDVVGEVNKMIVRLLAIQLTGRGDELLVPYREVGAFHVLQHLLDAYDLSLGEDGKWKRGSNEQA
ncbi:ApeA N-terminal domain 1-containing protein [Brachybacterium alimentarium]|uniref:ApeA N-terminal domain 1-containing protein n=1 Tax=Brachybacterium alimentarium TaxID=47845 RepID=UPI003FD5506E